jgi:hypothetical protein
VGKHQKISIATLLPPVLFFLGMFFAIFLKFHRLLDLAFGLTLPGLKSRGFLDQSVDLLVDAATKE